MTDKPKSQTDLPIADANWQWFLRACDHGHRDYIADAKRFNDFYLGDQWSPDDLERLREQKRPALTLNTILSTVNAVVGEQRSNRMDATFKPRLNGSDEIAEVLAKLALHVDEQNDLDWVESEVFADGIIEERGWFDVRVDFTGNIQGEIEIKSRDPRDVVLDPDAKEYDPRTWNSVGYTRWMTLDEIAVTYGKAKAEQVEARAANGMHYGNESVLLERNTFGDHDDSVREDEYDTDGNVRVKSARIIERQHKRLHYQRLFVDMETGDTSPVPEGWDDKKVFAFQQQFKLGVVKRLAPKIRWTVTCDGVVLHDDWSPYRSFTLIPFFAYFRRGRPIGMVRNLISPQELLNKVSSQELHVVNTTANSGWQVEEDSLTNMTTDDLEDRGAETGLVIEFRRGAAPPSKIQPNQIPSGLDRISTKAANAVREISGVNDGMLGLGGSEVSGVALQRKEARGMIQIRTPLDNLSRSRKYLMRKVLELLQDFYTDARMIQITREGPEAENETVEINQPQEDGSVLNDITVGEYAVVIGNQPSRDTFNDTQFAEALQLREAGVAIPDHVVIEYSHLQRRHEIAAQVKQMTGLAEPSEEEAQLMQMQQQMAIETAMAELDKLKEERNELAARANLQNAKAEQVTSEDDLRHREIESRIKLKRDELETRLRLAALTQQTRNREMGVRAATDAARMTIDRDKHTQAMKVNHGR